LWSTTARSGSRHRRDDVGAAVVTTFVCIHGAFRGGWSFDLVAGELARRGHEVRAPTLTGMDGAAGRPATVGLADWVADVVGVVERDELTDVVLVGHSQGGLVITAAAEQCRDRLASLAYLDAVEPLDGQRGVDLLPMPAGVERPPLPPADTWLPPTPLDAASGLAPELVSWANDRLCPTPLGPSLDAVTITAVGRSVPRSYLFCQRTPAGYPSVATRARLEVDGVEVDLIDAPHDVVLSHPVEVADWLEAR